MPLANGCCGDPACRYWQRGNLAAVATRQDQQHTRPPMATRPVEPSRWLDTGSRLLAIAAFCLGLLTAGGVALR